MIHNIDIKKENNDMKEIPELDEESKNSIKEINKTKKLLFEKDGVKVYAVDGPLIRDKIETDFIGGGHHFVAYEKYDGEWCEYDWIPKDEIWVEKDLPDKVAIAKHELEERPKMENGEEYPKAHKHAENKEDKFRIKIGDSRENLIKQIKEVLK